ncbi:hypothetical protein ACQ4M3_33680 [Leptolyngbya sp. AN03gr2]|uniref:hypothetical protein n=1 Tax=unclassified Leptolyngbya TaxID=2650499 RepID=UPI003D315675
MKQLYAISGVLALLMFGCSSTPSQSNSTTASPIVASSSDVIATGSFVAGEHSTKGGVQIINQNGKWYLHSIQAI